MDLLNDNQNKKNNQTTSMKMLKIVLMISTLLFIIVVTALVLTKSSTNNSGTLSLLIDDLEQELKTDIFIEKETGEIYIYIKDLISLVNGANYFNGQIFSIEENKEKGYVEFETGRVIGFTADSTEIYKSNLKSKDKIETFEIKSPILMNEDKLMIEINDIPAAFNLVVKFDSNLKQLNIYTDEYAKTTYTNKAIEAGYTGINAEEENLKLLSYGYVIVSKGNKLGIVTRENMEETIGNKYEKIVFNEKKQEFNVTLDGKKGIINLLGKIIIQAEYDDIQYFTYGDNSYYLVKQNNKFGVLDDSGENILANIYNDIIRIEANDNLYYIVKNNELFGLADINGTKIIEPIYDQIGFKGTANTEVLDLMTVELESGKTGIVVKQEDLYGLVDIETGEEILSCTFPKIYKTYNENNKEINVVELPEEGGIFLLEQYISFLGN